MTDAPQKFFSFARGALSAFCTLTVAAGFPPGGTAKTGTGAEPSCSIVETLYLMPGSKKTGHRSPSEAGDYQQDSGRDAQPALRHGCAAIQIPERERIRLPVLVDQQELENASARRDHLRRAHKNLILGGPEAFPM